MGFSVTASNLIWYVAVFGVLGVVVGTTFELMGESRETTERLRAVQDDRLHTRLSDVSFCHDSFEGQLLVRARNDGRTTLRLDEIALVADGVVVLGFAASVDDSVSTTLWLPRDEVTLTADGFVDAPSHVRLVLGNGVSAYPGKISCAIPASVEVAPSTVTLLTGATQAFSAVVYDELNDPIPDATVLWSASSGSIDAEGVYSAGDEVGAHTVTASSGSVSGDAVVTVQREVHVETMATFLDGAPASTFPKRTTIEVRVGLEDHRALVVTGASVTVEFVRPDGTVAETVVGVSDGSGIASVSHTTLASSPHGTWTARVTSVGGSFLVHDADSDVVTEVAFTVSPS